MPLGAVLAGAGMLGSLYQGLKGGNAANQAAQQAQRQAELEYNQREPLRRLGMTQLGQIEAPIDMGRMGFDTENPFAQARGPSPSTASMGNWGGMTFGPEAVTQALSGTNPQDVDWANDAMGAHLIGKSGGKQRFLGASGRQYTNDDRNHAEQRILQPMRKSDSWAGLVGNGAGQLGSGPQMPAPTNDMYAPLGAASRRGGMQGGMPRPGMR
jgi:hypothetical protein